MFRYAALAALSMLLAVSASAQRAPTFQSGQTNPGDIAKMQSNNAVTGGGDVLGDKNGKGVNPFAILDRGGLGLCTRTDATSKEHNAFCIGHDSDGNPVLTVDSYGGMAAKLLKCRINGVETDCPGNVEGGAIPVTILGVVADGVTDNSATLQSIIDGGKYRHIVFPRAALPYMLQHVDISKQMHITIEGTVKAHHVPTANNYMFSFNDGSEGSVLDGGGICDGNRAGLAADMPMPVLIQGCFESRNTKISARDITMQNFDMYGFSYNDCDPGNWFGPLTIKDSGLAFFGYTCNSAYLHVVAENIGPGGGIANYYQHPITVFGQSHSEGYIRLDGWSADTDNRDPLSVGVTLGADGPGNKWTVDVSNFTGTAQNGGNLSQGIQTKGGWASSYNFRSTGTLQAISLSGLMYSDVVCYADGEWLTDSNPNIPVQIRHGLHQYTNVASSAFDTHATMGPRGNTINCTGIRGDFNQLMGGENDDIRLLAEGNRAHGLKALCITTNEVFVPIPQCPDHVTLHLTARYNGDAGLYSSGFGTLTLAPDSDLSDNGQLGASAIGGLWRTGIFLDDTQGPIGDLIVQGVLNGRDTQNFTHTDALSFQPGTTDANNEYHLTMVNPSGLGLGQYITVANATGSGDATGKITDIHMVTGRATNGSIQALNYPIDDIRVQFSSPVTFSETGNLTNLTGTATSNGQTITLTGGAATTEIPGHMWLRAPDGQYRRVARVPNNNEIKIDYPFSPEVSGVTLQKLTTDVIGIPSQNYAMTINNTTPVGTLRFGGIAAKGTLVAPYALNDNRIRVGDSITVKGSSGKDNHAGGSTLYVGTGIADALSSNVTQLVNVTGRGREFRCDSLFAVPTGESAVCTVFKAGSLTPATCTIPEGQTFCEDLTHITSWIPGDRIAGYADQTNAATLGANKFYWSLNIDPIQ